MKLKVLPLDRWMKGSPDFGACVKHLREIVPIFDRCGIYKYGNLCWFESNKGAYEYWPSQFKYNLNLMHALELNARQAQALKDIVEQKLATKKQRELLVSREHAEYLRGIRRGR